MGQCQERLSAFHTLLLFMFLQGKIRAGKVALRESQSLRTRDVSESRQCAVLVHHDKTFWAKQAASCRQTCRGIHARTHEDQSMRAHACMGHAHTCRHTCTQKHMRKMHTHARTHPRTHEHMRAYAAHLHTHADARAHPRIRFGMLCFGTLLQQLDCAWWHSACPYVTNTHLWGPEEL